MRRSAFTVALVLASCLSGTMLLWLALPRVSASIAKAPAVAALAATRRGELVANAPLGDAIMALRLSYAAARDPAVLRDVGLLELILAEGLAPASAQQTATLNAGRRDLAESLAHAPISAYAWIRLAYAELILGAPVARVGQLLANSMATGSVVPELAFPRLSLILRLWADLPGNWRAFAGTLARQAWRRDPRRLAKMADQTGSVGIIRLALAPLPGVGSAFEMTLDAQGRSGPKQRKP